MNTLGIIMSNYTISPLFILLLVGGLIGIITFSFLLRYRKNPGVKFWLIWQLASSIWAFTYAFEYSANHIETKILWSKFSYFGIVYCPVSFLLFSLAFFGSHWLLQKKYLIILFSVATFFILPPFTNDLHHLHWISYSVDPVSHATDYVYGPLFWIFAALTYITLTTGIVNIFRSYFKLSDFFKQQAGILFFASLLPLTGNIIYIFQINPIPGFDWTPFSFLLTGILIAISISQFRLFDLVPFARNQLIDILPEAIMVIDKSLRIADYNPVMKRIINSQEKELNGLFIEKVIPARKELIEKITKQDNYQTQISKEIDGEIRYFNLLSTSLRDNYKNPNGWLILMNDITQHVQSEEKIKEANIRLTTEISEKEKLIVDLDAFSHTVAHDLKNMLGAIVSASSLIKSGIDSLSKDDLLEINELINLSATKTMYVTSELLVMASVRQQEIKPVAVNMQKVVRESIFRLKNMINDANALLDIPESWPDALGYEAWLEEVWINYISNALKYGGTPPVIKLGSEALPDHRVKFWIKDNGKGLSPEEMSMLFNKFTRLDMLRAEGHGLGLSIVKRIIEKLNGEVGIESNNIPGEGSTFYFILSQPDQTGEN